MTEHTDMETCICCENSTLIDRFLVSPTDGLLTKRFSIRQCTHCGLGITSPQPSDDELQILYTNNYHHPISNSRFTHITNVLRTMFLSHKYAILQAHVKGETLLDYGCGDGDFLSFATSRGTKAIGIDPHYSAESDNIFSSLDAPQVAHRTFDIITLWHVLEHVADPMTLLRSLSSKLTDNGKIFICLPNFNSWTISFGAAKCFHLHDVPRHIYHYTPLSLTLLLEKSNLRVISVDTSASAYTIFGIYQTIMNIITGANEFVYYFLKRGVHYQANRPPLQLLYLIALHILLTPFALAAALVLTPITSWFKAADTIEVVCEKIPTISRIDSKVQQQSCAG